jgi:hypothetical protein
MIARDDAQHHPRENVVLAFGNKQGRDFVNAVGAYLK